MGLYGRPQLRGGSLRESVSGLLSYSWTHSNLFAPIYNLDSQMVDYVQPRVGYVWDVDQLSVTAQFDDTSSRDGGGLDPATLKLRLLVSGVSVADTTAHVDAPVDPDQVPAGAVTIPLVQFTNPFVIQGSTELRLVTSADFDTYTFSPTTGAGSRSLGLITTITVIGKRRPIVHY